MTSSQIRQSFLDFFKSKQHTIVPSSSLMPDSPNLLFTNAGMNQFVPIFLGRQKCPYLPPRAADTQKCIRAGGKHNDLDDVGLDTYHHTFFEMLGNWSFGDYFKREAIDWAWELVTEIWKFPKSRFYATVYSPDKSAGDPSELDQEAWDFWAAKFTAAGLDPKIHIVYGNKKDNFWMMGETGPCGPCSEIHVDLTPNGDTQGKLVNRGDARCIEIWNLVFIQFNANPDGTFSPLPARHVDTGMGFERATSILQCTKNFTDFSGIISNYETDVFRPIFDKIEQLSGKKYGSTLPTPGMGSATVPVAAVGVPPTATLRSGKEDEGGRTAARDAQQSDRDGRAPQATSGTAYYKRRLPHFERPWAKYMVTFTTESRRTLSHPAKDIVLKSLLYGHEQRRYQLYAACVMPDHVHFLFEPQIKEEDMEGKPVFWPVGELLHSIKSFTAHEINKLEGASGSVWQNESFDRLIRGEADLEEKFHYICRNPWDSGVVPVTENYPWVWTPDAALPEAMGSATVPVAAVGVSPTASVRSGRADEIGRTAARDAQQSDRDGRAPHSVVDSTHPEGEAKRYAMKVAEQIAIDIAFRVIADHIRTLSFAIADGIQPGNTDRNYVLRRILRRAVRYGRTLGFREPFFYKLVDVLAANMGHVFPEIRAKKQHVQDVIRNEEEAFNKTLDNGIERFYALLALSIDLQLIPVARQKRWSIIWKHLTAAQVGPDELPHFKVDLESDFLPVLKENGLTNPVYPGGAAFELYDTYGFPLDLTELMARELGLRVDVEGFNKLMEEQRARARAAQKKEVISLSQIDTTTPTRFVGFEQLLTPAKVLEVVNIKDKTAVILDTSSAYAEMGGQVGDTGELSGGGHLWRIVNTQKHGNTFLHFLAEADAPQQGAEVQLSVDAPRRSAIQRHHTVTHLLHWALHEVVSRDASQKGSFVGPEKLTFDFNSPALTPAQVHDVEKLVNERILENTGVSWTEVPYADVRNRKDVMQFFGDKYGDRVRVVQIGGGAGELNGYSMELCGGTHTRATGEIGLFRIVAESAVAAGVRRIEAVAGLEAWRKATGEEQLIKTLAGKVNSPVGELEKKIEALLAHQRELEKQAKSALQREASNAASNLKAHAAAINGIPAIIHNLGEADADFLQAVADSLKGSFKGVVVLGGAANGAVGLVAAVSPDFTSKIQAGKIIQAIAPIVGGKGGGKPDNARGGGKDTSKLDEALAKARSLLG
jgi:alanyl-tRNA synthetase/REP element-mobilizing transposase RayT